MQQKFCDETGKTVQKFQSNAEKFLNEPLFLKKFGGKFGKFEKRSKFSGRISLF